ncbi:hypothetical protein FJTKL_03916 [Diaporthe vaccinii]|uniref:Uncharacterized protein n=1 Tax=Diaporthe vaccinii TaxID=105482 RepID=A0ABR4F1J9_9PEZI
MQHERVTCGSAEWLPEWNTCCLDYLQAHISNQCSALLAPNGVHPGLFHAFTDQEDGASKNRFRLLRHDISAVSSRVPYGTRS